MSGRRIALVLAFANYRTAPPLPTGIADTRALQRALADPQIGRFDRVDAQFDLPRALVQEHVQAFLAAGQKDDLVLLYIAGHMGLDTTGRFTIAAANAEDMQGTNSIDGAWLEEHLNRCVSKRVVLILDGRNSGAFGESIRARTGFDVSTTRDLAGPERVVLASAGISDLADTQVSKGDTPASFTDIVVRGITGGAVDIDGDGTVNVFELFEYAQKESARYFAARQRPLLRMFGGAPASIIIAYTTHEHNQQTSLGTAGLPDDLLSAVESTSITARQQAF